MAWLLHSLARVEGMNPESLLDGMTFAGGTMTDFLAHLDGKLGVNALALVGHSAIRRFVMADDSSTRVASDDEIATMQAVLDRALSDGGGANGKPAGARPSRNAATSKRSLEIRRGALAA